MARSVSCERTASLDKRAVTIRVEAISLFYRVPVSGEHVFLAPESGNQHQQRRFGQMKVGQQGIDHFEVESRIDKKPRFARAGLDLTALRGACCMFERPHSRGSHCYDAPLFLKSLVDLLSGFGSNAVPLAMELVVFYALLMYRLKCAQPDMQRKLSSLYSTSF